jgi:hypothetical protein
MKKGIQALKNLNERLEKGFKGNEQTLEMIKSLKFKVTGKRIKDAITAKVAILRAQLEELKRKTAEKMGNNVDENARLMGVIAVDTIETSNEPVTDTNPYKWEIRDKERTIERLERITRNIEEKKTFEISEWDLEEYGL